MRTELDSIGKISVAENYLWGAQTQRALKHFAIGNELMPQEMIWALAIIKKAAAKINYKCKKLDQKKSEAIIKAGEKIIAGKLTEHFPLTIWQSGSGTQTNMNINEVIAHLAKVHPNDHVNMSQSTNDVFPTAMHIAALSVINKKLFPALYVLQKTLRSKQQQFNQIIKVGRTHLQDAVPLTLGQEFSGYAAQINSCIHNLKQAAQNLQYLAIGGTAVGTGLNAPKNFAKLMAQEISQLTKIKFKSAPNKFAALAGHEPIVIVSSALKTLACALTKIANDIRWLASGPRCGLGELNLPSNEPGSSIMPGKINPTQCEVMLMVCAQVIGNDATITYAASQGNFELNVYKPLIIFNLLNAINLLTATNKTFVTFMLKDLSANKKIINQHLHNSLMLITALTPVIGYDKAAKVANLAQQKNISLREACVTLGILTAKEFDKLADPEKMV